MKKIGIIDNYNDLNKMPTLRKNNRIKSIHSSLAIEANSLSFNEIKDFMDFGVFYTTKELMNLLNMKSRVSFRKNYLLLAIEKDLIKISLPNSPTSKNQTYYKQ